MDHDKAIRAAKLTLGGMLEKKRAKTAKDRAQGQIAPSKYLPDVPRQVRDNGGPVMKPEQIEASLQAGYDPDAQQKMQATLDAIDRAGRAGSMAGRLTGIPFAGFLGRKAAEQIAMSSFANGGRAEAKDAFLAGNHPLVPDVLYHGTARDIQSFDPQAKRSYDVDPSNPDETDTGWFGKGHYFTASPKVAAHYADEGAKRQGGEGANVIPAHVSMKNPFVVDMKAYDSGAKSLDIALSRAGVPMHPRGWRKPSEQTAALMAMGHDGVIATREGQPQEYVAFHPAQIKSAISAKRFDPTSPDMTYADGGSVDDEDEGIDAYHGSPHDFDAFDIGKIGTGEGAQSYGHGLYFAGNEGVAKSYRNALSDTLIYPEGTPDLERRAGQMALTFSDNTPDGALRWLGKFKNGATHTSPAMTPELVEAVSKRFSSGEFRPGGHMYKVKLRVKPHELLDWDKPMSQQHPNVQAAIKAIGVDTGAREWKTGADLGNGNRLIVTPHPDLPDEEQFAKYEMETPTGSRIKLHRQDVERLLGKGGDLTGGQLHQRLVDMGNRDGAIGEHLRAGNPMKTGPKWASEALMRYGIKGIRYRDAGSRNMTDGDPTHNYVMFHHDPVKVVDKYEYGGAVGRSDGGYVPQKTQKAYKLFRTKGDGKLYPLFVHADKPVEMGKWLEAEEGPQGKAQGRVKSKIGDLAYRPGWHAGDLPIATHIGGKSDPSLKKPDYRPDNHVWAEVEMAADKDWQAEADSRGKGVKAHITDQVPLGGFYRYKTNPNMTGNWLIGGHMKVNRVLSDDEVKDINDQAGVADLPRLDRTQKADGGTVHLIHGGSDFDEIDPRFSGTGEPGNIRPLGKGLYTFVIDPSDPDRAKEAIGWAKRYATKYGRGKKALHVFKVPTSASTVFNGPRSIEEMGAEPQDKLAAYRAHRAAEPAKDDPAWWDWSRKGNALYEDVKNAADLRMEHLPIGLTEAAINNPKIAQRVGKFDPDADPEEIIKAIKGYADGGSVAERSPMFEGMHEDLLNDEGKPMELWHGTLQTGGFEAFDDAKLGTRDAGFYGRGHYLTPIKGNAEGYADPDEMGTGAVMGPLHAALKNPYIWDTSDSGAHRTLRDLQSMGIMKGQGKLEPWDNLQRHHIDPFMAEMKRRGHDGVLVKTDRGLSEVVVFKPSTIKHRDAEVGDPNDPRIMRNNGGRVDLYSKAARIIRGMKDQPFDVADIVKYALGKGVKKAEIEHSDIPSGKARPSQVAEHIEFMQPQIGVHRRETFYRYNDPERYERQIDYLERQGRHDEAEELTREFEAFEGFGGKDAPIYAKYQLPDGENYREHVLTLDNHPDDQTYNARVHWGKLANPLAHIRMSDRIIGNRKILHIEELQSDWNSDARKSGFRTGREKQDYEDYVAQMRADAINGIDPNASPMIKDALRQKYSSMDPYMLALKTGRQSEHNRLASTAFTASKLPSKAPYINPDRDDWAEMAMKHILTEAAKGGYDGIAFTPDKAQEERWKGTEFKNMYDRKFPSIAQRLVQQHDPQGGSTDDPQIIAGWGAPHVELTDKARQGILQNGFSSWRRGGYVTHVRRAR